MFHHPGLAKFFNVDEKIRTDVMYSFLVRLQQILDWFEVQTHYHFYSSSLLFIYEADLPPDPLKDPSKASPHSSKPTRGWTHPGEILGMKPDTYPLKRKKLNDGEGDSRDCHENHLEMDIDAVLEEGDKVCVTDAGSKILNNDEDLMQGHKCNGVHLVNSSAEEPASDDCIDKEYGVSHSARHKHLMKADETNAKKEELLNGPKAPHIMPSTHSTHTKHKSSNQSDALPPGDTTLLSESQKPGSTAPIEVRMIDFAHAIETTTRDENYIFGLKMLMQYIETLHSCYVG